MPEVDLRAVRVTTGSADERGYLAFDEQDRLLAVLVFLEDVIHGGLRGQWFMEAYFGRRTIPPKDGLFSTVDAAVSWLKHDAAGQAR